VIGHVRKGSSSPLYKPDKIAGTITTAGFTAVLFLVKDE
jgi:hypothetical protein